MEETIIPGRSETRCGWEFFECNGFWYVINSLQAMKAVRTKFEARADDIILASGMKTGTTWMKALIYSIMTYSKRSDLNSSEEDPLSTNNPHELIKNLEFRCFGPNTMCDVNSMASPRMLHTHLPYDALPESIKSSGCRVIYVSRNPKDTFVSLWHFYNAFQASSGIINADEAPSCLSKEEVFESFCRGVHHFGPFWDHVLGYWHQSLTNPNIMFVAYEDLQGESFSYVKKMASFLGISSLTDDDIQQIVMKCSFQSLSTLEVNKTGQLRNSIGSIQNSHFFRKGEVGDWKNYFTPEMNRRLDEITEEKLKNASLQFKYQLSYDHEAGDSEKKIF